MIIGIDASRANKKERTGTEWYAYHLIKKFSEIDRRNKFILYTKEPLQTDLKNLGPNFENRVLRWPPRFLWSQIRLAGEMLFRRPDVLFVPAHTIPLIHPARTVTTCHDVGFEEFPELYAQKRIGGEGLLGRFLAFFVRLATLGRYSNNELEYHRFSMRLAVRRARKIITPSKFTAREIKRHYPVKPEKIVITPLGFSEKYARLSQEKTIQAVLDRYSLKKPFFIFVGRLERKKNILGLIKSFYLFRKKYGQKEKLLLVGAKGTGWDKAEEFIKNKNLEKEIIRPGWVSGQEIPALYQAAQALVFVSYYEGFGIPPLEAMASGLPVIASNQGSLPEIIKSAGLLVHPDNHKKIAFLMHQVTKNKALREELIQKGFDRARHFSWLKCAQETLKIILDS